MSKAYFGCPIFGWVYNDRQVFFNEGSLIKGIMTADLTKPHLHYPTLGMAMKRGSLAETQEQGSRKMIKEYRYWGLDNSLFILQQGVV